MAADVPFHEQQHHLVFDPHRQASFLSDLILGGLEMAAIDTLSAIIDYFVGWLLKIPGGQ